jgi:hypothetical protein
LARDGDLHYADGTAVEKTPQGIKQFIVDKSWSRYQENGKDLPGIFNDADPPAAQPPPQPTPAPSNTGVVLSTTATTAATSTPTIFGPLPPKCHNEANFPGHADIYRGVVIQSAGFACSLWTGTPYGSQDRTLGPNSEKLSHTYENKGVNYEYSVEWIEGCDSAGPLSVYSPLGTDDVEETCLGLWSDCYEKCESNSPQLPSYR